MILVPFLEIDIAHGVRIAVSVITRGIVFTGLREISDDGFRDFENSLRALEAVDFRRIAAEIQSQINRRPAVIEQGAVNVGHIASVLEAQNVAESQRAKMLGLNGTLGTVPCQVSQSKFSGERSGGGGYSQAPLGSLRPSEPSTSVSVPTMPEARSSLAFVQMTELTRCEPICTMRPVFCAAATMATPSAAECDIGFSQ